VVTLYKSCNIRDSFLSIIESQSAYPSGFLCKIQGFAHPIFDTAAIVASIFGSEEFYIPLLATSAWIIQLEMALLLGTILALSLLLGNLLKNIFCLPRPRSPPVIVKANEHDWGMPRTHSITAITVPFYFVICLCKECQFSIELSIILLIFTGVWAATIMFSRMYLGLHSPADIFSGAILGLAILFSFIYFEDKIFAIYRNPKIMWQGPLCLLSIIYLHPRPYPTTSYYTSTIICGALNGFILTTHAFYNGIIGTSKWHPIIYANFDNPIRNTLLRAVIGLGILLLTKEIAKPIIYSIFVFFCDLFGIPYEKYQQKKIEATRSFTHVGVLERLFQYQAKIKKKKRTKIRKKFARK